MCSQVRLKLWSEFKPRNRKQEEKRLSVSFYLLSNEGITASLCFQCCFQPVVRDLPSCSRPAHAGFKFIHVYPHVSDVKDSLNTKISLNATCFLGFCSPDWLLLPSFCSYTLSYYLILRSVFVFTNRCAYLKKILTFWSKTRRCFLEPCLQREKKTMFRIFDDSFLFISSVRLFCSSKNLTKGRLFRSYTRRSRRYWCFPASPLPPIRLDALQECLTKSMEANWGQLFQSFPSSARLTRDSMRWLLLPAACATQTRLWFKETCPRYTKTLFWLYKVFSA